MQGNRRIITRRTLKGIENDTHTNEDQYSKSRSDITEAIEIFDIRVIDKFYSPKSYFKR